MKFVTQRNRTGQKSRLFHGWKVVAAASLQGMFGNGAISSGFPIFFEPVRQSLGISYTSMSVIFSMGRAEGGMGGPLVGWMVDRFGGRPMILFGGVTAGIGMILLSRATTYWQFLLLFVGVISVGKTAGLGQTLMATVNQWFVRRKALAMSTLMTSFAGGGAIIVPLLSLGISSIGWRDTLLFTGIFIALLTLPVAAVIRSRPEDMGLLPDGDELPASAEPSRRRKVSELAPGDFTVRQATRTSAFWFMLMGLVMRVSATNAIIIHLFPILEGEGIEGGRAALFVSAMFFMAIPLRFGLGVAGGHISPRKLLFVGMNSAGLGLLGLRLIDGWPGLLIFIVGMAIVEGISSVNWIMLGDYFGRSRFASLMGFMSVFHNIGLVISPIYSGWIRDQTGAYDLVLVTFIPIFMVGGLAFALARKPTPPEASVPATLQSAMSD